ncbi:LysR family transcriptional regulator [Streptomyces sp. NBC_00083]|uniref:LysR family transcriptional regulator n=1 Tax=Streptomyces sp. NBC_00083 TaxID=2975647 RepID=UPI00225C366A|nr:LysR substrate-binding domain-containing protein [Streptomyces sp. NBC_00083]MCX5387266.1 LysR substrate-binding domain-containing protein [Streptomyces sp. NBC_00083]
MELRDIEIFLTLADELHFGRTAQRLHLSQARVSQSVAQQERRLGGALFDRSTRAVALTVLGKQLRDDLLPAYEAIRTALAHATETARGAAGVVRLGVMGALPSEIEWLVRAYRDQHPGCDVEFVEFHFSDPAALVLSREVDLQLLWLPVPQPHLEPGPVVFREGRVLAVADGSDLAARTHVTMEDLAGRTVIDPGTRVPKTWFAAMCPERTPLGHPVHRGPRAETFHEILALVASGRAVCPLNAHVVRYYRYPGVTLLPITDAPPTEWVLALPRTPTPPHVSATPPHVSALLATARELGPRTAGPH